jgi:DNA helicase-4
MSADAIARDQVWGSTTIGSRLTRGQEWSARLRGDDVLVECQGETRTIPLTTLGRTRMRRGFLYSCISWPDLDQLNLTGIPNRLAAHFIEHLESERNRVQEEIRVRELVVDFDYLVATLLDWARAFFAAAKLHQETRGWMTRDLVAHWQALKPAPQSQLLDLPELLEHRSRQAGDVLEAIDLWEGNLQTYASKWNARFQQSEIAAYRDFFDRVEKSPLTDEQATAVVCFDNRVQVIASAGSGKTSTMVAKAGYAIHRGLVPAKRILLLAFNKEAAAELQNRIIDRLTPLGLPAEKIVARTFHAFGISVIGEATGRKPRLAPWAEPNRDVRKIEEIVDTLRDQDPGFRTEWDLFRLVFGRDLPEFGQEESDPDGWDPASRRQGFQTLGGQIVKSQGERLIADWLFYNGIRYEYEGAYETDTADAGHSQYHPDFYYPDINVYHEHFALDAAGKPPEEFLGYLDGVAWKRSLHAERGTTLIETTMSQLWDGGAFTHLTTELTSRGIALDPNPDRPVSGQPPLESEKLASTFRSFMVHAKSNRLSIEQLSGRALGETRQRFRYRHEMFLRLYARIRESWDAELALDNCIDFEDMLTLAADHIESGQWKSPFDLVMVDEMQDASFARARLARALTTRTGTHLFTVGDDWQSINRFAGADLAVMTQFDEWFGEAETLRLERTFRCPQSLCDISSRFVMKNPNQLTKQVRSTTDEHPPTITAIAAASTETVPAVIRDHLGALDAQLARAPGAARASVFILGRYRFQEALVPTAYLAGWTHLDVSFLTIHAAKGLEADYVIIPGLTRDKGAFPSKTVDDPVLQLAMPQREDFPHAEERRLFYVALTRARKAVTLITVLHHESSFLTELVNEQKITLATGDGDIAHIVNCPVCGKGSLVPRTSRYGRFYSCSAFPKCSGKMTERQMNEIVDLLALRSGSAG